MKLIKPKSMSRKKILKRFSILVIFAVLVTAGVLYMRPLPVLEPVKTAEFLPSTSKVELPWPSYGQAALGSLELGMLDTKGAQTAAPIASITKVVTALAVLKQKPLNVGQQGPIITFSDQDVAFYNDYVAKGGSVVPVSVGQQITEYQALEAMLIPSANNIADSLVLWAFGSLDNYVNYANQLVKDAGLQQTYIADASGFSPQTVSSASDLVKLGEIVLSDPVISKVVSQAQASLPAAVNVKSTNWLLDSDGVIGIKTGNTDEAGGCFLFAAKRTVASQTITLIGAIMGAPTRTQAIADARSVIIASDSGFEPLTIVKAGQTVGYYQVPWDSKVPIIAKNDLSLLRWRGLPVQVKTALNDAHIPAEADSSVGSLNAVSGQRDVNASAILKQPLPSPSWQWRIWGR